MSFSLRQAEIEWKKVEGILRQALHLTKRALRIRVGITAYRRGSDALPADAFGARVNRAFPDASSETPREQGASEGKKKMR